MHINFYRKYDAYSAMPSSTDMGMWIPACPSCAESRHNVPDACAGRTLVLSNKMHLICLHPLFHQPTMSMVSWPLNITPRKIYPPPLIFLRRLTSKDMEISTTSHRGLRPGSTTSANDQMQQVSSETHELVHLQSLGLQPRIHYTASNYRLPRAKRPVNIRLVDFSHTVLFSVAPRLPRVPAPRCQDRAIYER
jgi:hypothetical protein